VILVTGASGSIGRDLVRRLQAARAPFRALVRDEAKGRALGCDFVVGDFGDPGSVAAAMRGAERLFLNGAGAQPADGDQPMIAQQKTVIDAARAAGVSQVVKISVWGAREDGRLGLGAHWQIEQYLGASGLGWSVLQPGGFMQNFLTGAGSVTGDGNLIDGYGGAAVSYIDCRDIAACAAALLTGSGRNGETFVLTGPEALTHAAIADKLSAALGRAVGLAVLPPDRLASMLKAQGLLPRFADDVAVLSREVAAGSMATTTAAVQDLTGHAPGTFDRFVADNRRALQAAFTSAAIRG
jgi:NAD(P)H dehydrogenase (quinone)